VVTSIFFHSIFWESGAEKYDKMWLLKIIILGLKPRSNLIQKTVVFLTSALYWLLNPEKHSLSLIATSHFWCDSINDFWTAFYTNFSLRFYPVITLSLCFMAMYKGILSFSQMKLSDLVRRAGHIRFLPSALAASSARDS